MRTRDEMLKDALVARNGYAYLKNSEDALPVRLGQDVTELLKTLAERDEEIERLKADLAQSRSAITKLSREIWKVC